MNTNGRRVPARTGGAVAAKRGKQGLPRERGWYGIATTVRPALGRQGAAWRSPEAHESGLKPAKAVLYRETGYRHLTFLIYPREE